MHTKNIVSLFLPHGVCSVAASLGSRASAVHVTLLAFAAERRRPQHVAPASGAPCSIRLMSPVRGALSIKLAARRCCCRPMGQTDGQTDAGPFHRPCSAYYVGSVNTRACDHFRAAVGTEFLSPYPPHTHTHGDPHGRPGSLVLRLSNTNLSLVSRASFGAGSFSAAAPTTWNSLPPSLRTCTSPDTFRRHLNTDYFQHAFQTT